MTTEVNVLRVFSDAAGKFGNPRGVVLAGAAPAKDRQRIAAELGYSETVFIEESTPGSSAGWWTGSSRRTAAHHMIREPAARTGSMSEQGSEDDGAD